MVAVGVLTCVRVVLFRRLHCLVAAPFVARPWCRWSVTPHLARLALALLAFLLASCLLLPTLPACSRVTGSVRGAGQVVSVFLCPPHNVRGHARAAPLRCRGGACSPLCSSNSATNSEIFSPFEAHCGIPFSELRSSAEVFIVRSFFPPSLCCLPAPVRYVPRHRFLRPPPTRGRQHGVHLQAPCAAQGRGAAGPAEAGRPRHAAEAGRRAQVAPQMVAWSMIHDGARFQHAHAPHHRQQCRQGRSAHQPAAYMEPRRRHCRRCWRACV